MIGHHAVVHVHRKQGHAQRKQVGEQGRQQDVVVERAAFRDHAPEPVVVAAGADLGGARIVALGRPRVDRAAQVVGFKLGQRHIDRSIAQFRVNDAGLGAVLIETEQHTGAFIVQQDDGGKQRVLELGQRTADELAAEVGAPCGAGEKTGRQATLLGRQPGHEGVAGR